MRVRLALPALLLALLGGGTDGAVRAQTEERAQRLERTLRAIDQGQWGEAHRSGQRTGLPELRAYVRWRELLEARPDERPGFAVYADFLEHEPDWPSLGLVQARAEETLDERVGLAERLAFFADRPPRTRQGRVRLAEAMLARGQSEAAAQLVRTSWARDEFSIGEEAMLLARFGFMLRASDHAARLDRLLWDGQTAQARRMLARVERPQRLLAEARLALQQSEPGAESALAAVPEALRGDAGLMFDRLRWRKRKGLEDGVRAILLDPPDELGRPELWWRERHAAIRDAINVRSFKLAYRLAAAHRQSEGTAFAEGEWLAGWLALRFIDEPKLASRHFERLWQGVGTPISLARAGYWAGRAAAVLDQDEAAAWYGRAAAYPSTFYGQLAALEIEADPWARLEPPVTASAAARAALQQRTPAQLARLFCAAGQPRAAQPFFRHLGHEAAGDRDQLTAVTELAEACGRADLALVAARASAANGGHSARAAFPMPRLRAFRDGGPGVPEPALLLALARQESLFDPEATSPAGALGLMQLMPGTAAAVAREQGLKISRNALLTDPALNVRLGASYLQRQLDRFAGEAALALAAYNAGPRRVAQWLEANGDPRSADRYRLIDWIELIPFNETRNYVQRVLEGRGMYRAILAGPRTPAAARTVAAPPVPRAAPPRPSGPDGSLARTAADLAPTPTPRLKPAS